MSKSSKAVATAGPFDDPDNQSDEETTAISAEKAELPMPAAGDRYNDGYQAGASRYKENVEEGMTRYVGYHNAIDASEKQPEDGRYREGFLDGIKAVHGHMKSLRDMTLAHEAAIADLQIEKRSFEK
jgi:hypothetical protein